MGLTILFSATYAFVRIGVAYYMQVLTDAAVAGQSETFLRLLAQSSGLLVFDLAMYYVWTHVEARFTAYLMRDLRDRIAEHVQRMPLSALERYHSGDLVIRLMDHIPWIADYLLFVAQFVYQPLILFASIAFIASINWKMLLVFLTITPLSAPLYARLSRPVQDLSKRLTADQASAGAIIEDTVKGASVIKAFGLQGTLSQRYGRLAAGLQRTRLQVQKLSAYLLLVGQVLRYLPMLGTIVLGGYLAYRGEMTVGAVMAISTTMLVHGGPDRGAADHGAAHARDAACRGASARSLGPARRTDRREGAMRAQWLSGDHLRWCLVRLQRRGAGARWLELPGRAGGGRGAGRAKRLRQEHDPQAPLRVLRGARGDGPRVRALAEGVQPGTRQALDLDRDAGYVPFSSLGGREHRLGAGRRIAQRDRGSGSAG